MNSWYTIRARDTGAELSIYDEIGAYGVSAKAFIAEIGALEAGTALELRLNSPGGSVFDAVAIYNALKRHDGPVTVTIDGIAASAASYVAMAGDEIVMPENAFLMIHDPSGLVMGTAGDMRAMAEALDKIAGSLIKGYAAKSGKPEDDIATLMAAETWFDAAEAVEAGFADRVAEPVRIAARFDIGAFRNAPTKLAEAVPDEPEAVDLPEPDANEPDEDPLDAADEPAMPPDIPDAQTIRAEAMAHAKAVVDLCRLAGQPQMAAGFLETETSLDAVRAALLDVRAKSDPDISASHPQPGPGPAAKPWGDVIARTFKRKGQ
ncbi:Clp protease ClpP [Seohaeicola saemankumensis]|nr:head maturation protease, ClpP-related [Seohaeicola saemankumensis]MCA0871370.1 Clp protease ClpP [Seohaeicola saemankumensis]